MRKLLRLTEKLVVPLLLLVGITMFWRINIYNKLPIKKLDIDKEYLISQIDNVGEYEFMCVLTGYQNRISEEYPYAKLINPQLEDYFFFPNEGPALVFFDSDYQADLVRLNFLHFTRLQKADSQNEKIHDCGKLEEFYVYRFSEHSLLIYRR